MRVSLCFLLIALTLPAFTSCANHGAPESKPPRAVVLAEGLAADSKLRSQLLTCKTGGFEATSFSIAHRGAPLGYPEHTRESYEAAARMGAGLIECDVTFTKDLALVCRHSQCDLHRTTNILTTPLAERCSSPFSPATETTPASARCCTSDITLREFKTLTGRSDFVDTTAKSVAEYLAPRPSPVSPDTINAPGTLLTHSESIALIDTLGAQFVPELKRPEVTMPFAPGFDQHAYLAKMLSEYETLGIDPRRVHPQSFNIEDIDRIVAAHPAYAARAVYLDPRGRDPEFRPTAAGMAALYARGVRVLAPPMPMLLTLDDRGTPIPSEYARLARAAGLELVTWTFEAGRADDPQNWLYRTVAPYMDREEKMLEILRVLDVEVGVQGIFSDWPGTVTYYANCREEAP